MVADAARFCRLCVRDGDNARASFRVFQALSLDLDAKYYRLDRGRSLGTFGGGVSYRF